MDRKESIESSKFVFCHSGDFGLKKGKDSFCLISSYGRFLSSNIANDKADNDYKTIMPATAGTKYMSAAD